jgi:HlyD family secretion protein
MISPTIQKPLDPISLPTEPGKTKRPTKKKPRWIWWVVGIVVVGLGLSLWGWHYHAAAALAAQTPAEVATVTRTTLEKTVESAGKVLSFRDTDIKCRASGPVAELPVHLSDAVKEGQLLCKLDPADEQLAVDVAKQSVAQSTAKLEQARLAYEQAKLNLETTRSKVQSALVSAKVKAEHLRSKADRQKQLKDQQLGSEEDYETAETEAATAESDASAAQAAVNELKQQELQLESKKLDIVTAESALKSDTINLHTQERQLGYTTVVSPWDGVISSVTSNLGVGYIIQAGTGGVSGGTTIMTVTDRSHVIVSASVDQSDLRGVALGQPARVEVDSYPERSFAAQVIMIAQVGQNVSNVVTFEVRVEVTDKDKNLLHPQMTGTVTIIEAQRKNVLVVPTAAVEHRANQTFVHLVGGKEQPVTLGLDGGENVEVLSGLNEGDKVTLQALELPTRWKSSDR